LVQKSRRVSKNAEFYADFKSNEKVEKFSPKESKNSKIFLLSGVKEKNNVFHSPS
jgi:hypothetical protein